MDRDPTIEALARVALVAQEENDARREKQRQAALAAAESARVYQLAFWPDDERALPGDFIACALFSASKVTGMVDGQRLASINGLSVVFTGKRLNQTHADVWMAIMHMARERLQNDVLRFRARELLELIGRHTGKSQRDELLTWLRHLSSASVEIHDEAKRQRFGGVLLPDYEVTTIGETSFYEVRISRWLAKVLSGRFWCINWEIRRALMRKPLALWLQTYLARFTKPTSVAQLHALAGSNSSLKKFRENLRVALGDLRAAKGPGARIDKQTDSVVLDRQPTLRRSVGVANDRQVVLPFARPAGGKP